MSGGIILPGNALVTDVASGKTFSSAAGFDLTGTLVPPVPSALSVSGTSGSTMAYVFAGSGFVSMPTPGNSYLLNSMTLTPGTYVVIGFAVSSSGTITASLSIGGVVFAGSGIGNSSVSGVVKITTTTTVNLYGSETVNTNGQGAMMAIQIL